MPTTQRPIHVDEPTAQYLADLIHHDLKHGVHSDEDQKRAQKVADRLDWALDTWRRDRDRRDFDPNNIPEVYTRKEEPLEQPPEPPEGGETEE
jgi:hypothetical protein